MSEKHTPGPWKWYNYPDGRKLLSGFTCAVIHCPISDMSVTDADQALIAAAPKLLARVKELEEALADACRLAAEYSESLLARAAAREEPTR